MSAAAPGVRSNLRRRAVAEARPARAFLTGYLALQHEGAIRSAANCVRALLKAADVNLRQAVLGYNHSQVYVSDVLARARACVTATDEEREW